MPPASLRMHCVQSMRNKAQNAGQSPELKWKCSKRSEDPDFGKHAILTNRNRSLGHYCELQFIKSPHAIAWSIFGLVNHATRLAKYNWMLNFLQCFDLDDASAKDAPFFFWRRLPNTKKPANLCPEYDIMITTKMRLQLFSITGILHSVNLKPI
jgi:hypothetical protein